MNLFCYLLNTETAWEKERKTSHSLSLPLGLIPLQSISIFEYLCMVHINKTLNI